MAGLGCEAAINLDGGGSTTLSPADGCESPARRLGAAGAGGRPVSTALLLTTRG
jgi:hypothetical protein